MEEIDKKKRAYKKRKKVIATTKKNISNTIRTLKLEVSVKKDPYMKLKSKNKPGIWGFNKTPEQIYNAIWRKKTKKVVLVKHKQKEL